jgi:hypothetical protein
MASVSAGSELEDWRRRRLLQVGVPPGLARVVSGDPRYDLHALLVLTDRGCDPEVAVRILAPLDDERCSAQCDET